MITFFTIPKAFAGPFAVKMNNAIKSWTLLKPRPEIMLFGHEKGIDKAARRFGCIQKSLAMHKEFGIPLINRTFKRAQKNAKTSLMCFANTDIILTQDFMSAVERVSQKFTGFLMVGCKTDVDIDFKIDFAEDWEPKLRDYVSRKSKLHSPTGIDYFVFTKGLYVDIPPFMIGRTAWDNWLVWHILQRNIPVIDVTGGVLAVHQHRHWLREKRGPAYDYNRRLAGKAGRWGRINYSTWVLTLEDIRERRT